MTFEELPICSEFFFPLSNPDPYLFRQGPWIKTSPTCFRHKADVFYENVLNANPKDLVEKITTN